MVAFFMGRMVSILYPPLEKGITDYRDRNGLLCGRWIARVIQPNKAIGPDETVRFVEGNRMLKESIASQMGKHGLKIIEGNDADLIVAHLIIILDNVSTSYSNQYYGYQDFSEIVGLLNSRPRKTRGFQTPEEVMAAAGVALGT